MNAEAFEAEFDDQHDSRWRPLPDLHLALKDVLRSWPFLILAVAAGAVMWPGVATRTLAYLPSLGTLMPR